MCSPLSSFCLAFFRQCWCCSAKLRSCWSPNRLDAFAPGICLLDEVLQADHWISWGSGGGHGCRDLALVALKRYRNSSSSIILDPQCRFDVPLYAERCVGLIVQIGFVGRRMTQRLEPARKSPLQAAEAARAKLVTPSVRSLGRSG